MLRSKSGLFVRRPVARLAVAAVALLMVAGVMLSGGTASAKVIDPAQPNIPSGWPWKINNLIYPTLGYPQIIKSGGSFTLEFDVNGRARGNDQPDVEDWDVYLVSSKDTYPTVENLSVRGTVRDVSARWFKGSASQAEANGEWAGPWAGKEVWKVTVNVPSDARADLYDLEVVAELDGRKVTDSQPHAVSVVDAYKDNYTIAQLSDFHINDPRGPSDSFIPGPFPDPSQFKGYVYNVKAIEDVNLLNPDFAIMTGDIPFGVPIYAHTYDKDLDPDDDSTDYTDKAPGWEGEYNKSWENLLNLEVPVVCVPGNHDAYNLQQQNGKNLDYTNGPQDGAHIWPTVFGPRYFGFNYGDKCHISCIFGYDKIQRDTDWLNVLQRSFIPTAQLPPLDGGNGHIRPNQIEWLTKDLGASKGRFDLMLMAVHQPFYGESSWDTWDSQAQMDLLNGFTHTYNVEAALTGHTHSDDVFVDRTVPSKPVLHLNTTTTSFGTMEYPGYRMISVNRGVISSYNYKGPDFSYPTYKGTQIKHHQSGKEAREALKSLDTPSVVGVFDSDDPSSTDKTFKTTNYLLEGDPAVYLNNTVARFEMADLGPIGCYNLTGGTLVDAWRPENGNLVMRVRTDPVAPGATVSTRVRALYIASITPKFGKTGETLNVEIDGNGTGFVQGVSQVVFDGGGVAVNSVNVTDPEHLTASITIDAGAKPGPRGVNVVTGSEIPFGLNSGFTVVSSGPYIRACTPDEVVQGHEFELFVLGRNTHFKDGQSRVTISGKGVSVLSTKVTGDEHCSAWVKVSDNAQPGWRDLDVVTGGEDPIPLFGGLGIHKAPDQPPFIRSLAPSSGMIGTEVKLRGGNFGAARGASRVTFAGVPATKFVSWSDTEIICNVPVGAKTGPVVVRTPWGVSEPQHFKVTNMSFYFAEGTLRSGFDPYISVSNPEDDPATVEITYMLGDGTTKKQDLTVKQRSRATVVVRDFLGSPEGNAADFSARVECTNGQLIIAERPMYFDYQGTRPGGTDALGALTPATSFYFAEGTVRPAFDSYLCIENPANADAGITVNYMTGDGGRRAQQLVVAAHSRSTVNVRDILGTGEDAAHDFSAKVESTNGVAVVAERTMYFNYQGAWTGGHDVVGEVEPQENFQFAEGTCRPNFDPYLCIQNPGGARAHVMMTFMLGNGEVKQDSVAVPAHSRQTVRVRDVLGSGDDTAHDFSVSLECTNGQEIVAERPMYFNYSYVWPGGSNVMGAPTASDTFYFAEGTTRPGFDAFLCIQNPEPAHADIKITYMTGDGGTKEQKVSMVEYSRATIRVSDILGQGNDAAHDFSAIVESTGPLKILAERPMYFDYGGWAPGGHDAIGFSPI